MLQRDILEKRELYHRILSKVREILGDRLRAVIVFGSHVYLGGGNDIDLAVVIDGSLDPKSKLKLEYRVKKALEKAMPGNVFDVHAFNVEDFKENLEPGTALSGLALGYKLLYGEEAIEQLIIGFLEKLSREKYILHNKYGSWNLSFHAKVLYKLKQRQHEERVAEDKK